MSNPNAFEELKKILLEEDQRETKRINEDLRSELQVKIDELEAQLNDPVKFSTKIEASKKQIVDILGPVMGSMIRKYVSSEIEKLNDSIDKRKEKFFGLFKWRDKNIKNIQQPKIIEILLIEEESGLLLGKFSKDAISDTDMFAGMLTAIRSFMQEAVNSSDQDVSLIEYNDFRIFLHNYGSYYFCVIFEGRNSPGFIAFLRQEIDKFSDKHRMHISPQDTNDFPTDQLNGLMNTYFERTCAKLAEKLF